MSRCTAESKEIEVALDNYDKAFREADFKAKAAIKELFNIIAWRFGPFYQTAKYEWDRMLFPDFYLLNKWVPHIISRNGCRILSIEYSERKIANRLRSMIGRSGITVDSEEMNFIRMYS